MTRSILLAAIITVSLSIFGQEAGLRIHQRVKKTPIIFGHRGDYSVDRTENSLSQFEYLLATCTQNVVGIEIDIRISANGTLFLMHDADLQRTTNGSGEIIKTTDIELKKLRLKNSGGEITNEVIPTFANALSFAKAKPIILMLDVKGDILEQVIKEVQQHQMENQCILLTFKPEATIRALKLTESLLISALIKSETDLLPFSQLKDQFNRMAAYISPEIEPTFRDQLIQSGFLLLTDVLETKNQPFEPHHPDYYRSVIQKTKLNFVVTDFPVHLSKIVTLQKFD